jgi:hypothetical protein
MYNKFNFYGCPPRNHFIFHATGPGQLFESCGNSSHSFTIFSTELVIHMFYQTMGWAAFWAIFSNNSSGNTG